jgi:hypothetical protein
MYVMKFRDNPFVILESREAYFQSAVKILNS